MIRLHCTGKLLPKLPINGHGRLSSAPHGAHMLEALNPLSGWHGTVFLVKGRNCAVLVHETTRFCIILPCLTKEDFTQFDRLFRDALLAALDKVGAQEEQIATAKRLAQPFIIDNATKDTMQAPLSQVKTCIDRMLWENNTSIEKLDTAEVSSVLAGMPFKVRAQKEVVWPKKSLLALLDDAQAILERTQNFAPNSGAPRQNEADQASTKVVSMVDFRTTKKT